MGEKTRIMRSHKRILSELNCSVDFTGENIIHTTISDLSMGGVFARCNNTEPAGSLCDISLQLSGSSPMLKINAMGIVARHTDNGIGIQFTHFNGNGSYIYLKQIVLCNRYGKSKPNNGLADPYGLFDFL
ncbi:MAG: PilZ domain-containing protein [Planctomycetes bacterium]|nr:PilZ domain-containing protein [Planctomycetota bacterium]